MVSDLEHSFGLEIKYTLNLFLYCFVFFDNFKIIKKSLLLQTLFYYHKIPILKFCELPIQNAI